MVCSTLLHSWGHTNHISMQQYTGICCSQKRHMHPSLPKKKAKRIMSNMKALNMFYGILSKSLSPTILSGKCTVLKNLFLHTCLSRFSQLFARWIILARQLYGWYIEPFLWQQKRKKNLQKCVGYLGRFETRDIVNIFVYFHFYRVSHIEMVKMKGLSILSTAETNLLSTLYYDLELVPAFYNPPLTFITQQLFLFCSLINQQETRGFI